MQIGAQMVIGVARNLTAIAKAYPAAAPEIREMNNLLRQVQAKIMQSQQPGEPQAPPMS